MLDVICQMWDATYKTLEVKLGWSLKTDSLHKWLIEEEQHFCMNKIWMKKLNFGQTVIGKSTLDPSRSIKIIR
jgi:hypothetical protein